MSYLDVISLERAKLYLRIDDDVNETDSEITNMIIGALSFIEKRTNHIMYQRDKVFIGNCTVNVYDYPINTIPNTSTECLYSTYSNITTDSTNKVILNVGYSDVANIPEELIQAALQILKVWYYEAEKQVNTTLIPESVLMALDLNKRYIC